MSFDITKVPMVRVTWLDARDMETGWLPINDIVNDSWDRPYSIAEACYPADKNPSTKYWPTVNRIDNVYGDRNLICACPPIESFKSD